MTTFKVQDCEVLKETDKAILVESPNLGEPLWVPQSQVHADSEVWREGDVGVLVISEWFAEKSGLVD